MRIIFVSALWKRYFTYTLYFMECFCTSLVTSDQVVDKTANQKWPSSVIHLAKKWPCHIEQAGRQTWGRTEQRCDECSEAGETHWLKRICSKRPVESDTNITPYSTHDIRSASRDTFSTKHLRLNCSNEKRGTRKIPLSLGLIEKLQFYSIQRRLHLFLIVLCVSQEEFRIK